MKLFTLLSFLTLSSAFAADFEDFKSLYEQGIAPGSVGEVEKFLDSKTKCLGMNKNSSTFYDVLVVEDVLLKRGAGPAFPDKRIKAVLLGKSQPSVEFGMNYSEKLTADGLDLVTAKTVTTEDCVDDEDFGQWCSDNYDVKKDVKIRIKFVSPYLVYHDSTNGVYGYCW